MLGKISDLCEADLIIQSCVLAGLITMIGSRMNILIRIDQSELLPRIRLGILGNRNSLSI